MGWLALPSKWIVACHDRPSLPAGAVIANIEPRRCEFAKPNEIIANYLALVTAPALVLALVTG